MPRDAIKMLWQSWAVLIKLICLYIQKYDNFIQCLIVFSPPITEQKCQQILPVMFFVHDCESFEIGSGNAYDGSVMAALGNMIVVTFNYRLGVFGEF